MGRHVVEESYERTTAIVLLMNIWDDCVSYTMAPHTITPAVGAVSNIESFITSLPHAYTIATMLKLNQNSSLKTNCFHSIAVQSRRLRSHSKRRRQWVGFIGSTLNENCNSNSPSFRYFMMVLIDTGPVFMLLFMYAWRTVRELHQV